MPNTWFQFKQFRINQAQNAMKVTTDACVFGALADFSGCSRIIDIGAGTGLLSLMLAQRFPESHVTGIEIDEASFLEMQQNFTDSPWSDRLKALHMNVVAYAENEENNEKYDGIISNPPFFHSSLKSENSNLNRVRHSDNTLTLMELLSSVKKLLTSEGKFYCLYPWNRKDELIAKAADFGLFLNNSVVLQNTNTHQPHRIIMEFGFRLNSIPKPSVFNIRNKGNSAYSEELIELMASFYL